jgi:hypothetical protein
VRMRTPPAQLNEYILHALANNPDETLADLQGNADRSRQQLSTALEVLLKAQTALDARREIDDERLTILDRFYAKLPGWENDPVSQKLLVEVADMSEAAIVAERDLWFKCEKLEIMYTALSDHRKGLEFISDAHARLKNVVRELEVARVANSVDALRHGSAAAAAAAEAHNRLKAAKIGANQAFAKAKLASLCCKEIPRIDLISVKSSELLVNVDVGFNSPAVELVARKTISEALVSARATLSDCDQAVAWVIDRTARIESDISDCEADVELLEQDVIEERMGLLRQHHDEIQNYVPPKSTAPAVWIDPQGSNDPKGLPDSVSTRSL